MACPASISALVAMLSTSRISSCRKAETTDMLVNKSRLLHVAQVPRVRDSGKLRTRNCSMELLRNVQRAATVIFTPQQERRTSIFGNKSLVFGAAPVRRRARTWRPNASAARLRLEGRS